MQVLISLCMLAIVFTVPLGVVQANANQPAKIEVDPGDTPLVISGKIKAGEDFWGNIRLVAREAEVPLFTVLPSDLVRKEGEEILGRQQVEMLGDKSLKVNLPTDFQVKVKGVEVPGTYQGKIEILPDGQTTPLTVPLKVIARASPILTPLEGTKKVDLALVNCSGWIDCSLARLLLPESAFLQNLTLNFDNPVLAPIEVEDVGLVAQGKFTAYPLSKTEIAFPDKPQTMPANKIVSLTAALKRTQIPPDQFTGNIYLTLKGADQRLTLPLELNVRSGPFWPLMVILLGIILGRLVKYMQERGRPQSEALQAVYRTENLVNGAHPDDQTILLPMVEEIRQSVYQEKLDTVTQQLDAVENRLKILQELRVIEDNLQGKQQHPDAQKALKLVAQIRDHLRLKDDSKAKDTLEEVKTLLGKLQSTMMGATRQLDPAVAAASKSADAAAQAAGQAAQAPPLKTSLVASKWKTVKNWLARLSGLSDEIRAEATLWIVRPLLYFALLVGILAVGISTLYIEKGTTFGAHPFMDYFSLALWGLSADVVSRNLSNLRGSGSE